MLDSSASPLFIAARVKMAFIVLVLCAVTATASSAQTFTSLFSFNGADGEFPSAGLVQGTDGSFYGTAANGGANSFFGGTIFKITSKGVLTTLYTFCAQTNCKDGAGPATVLVQGTDGNFYGTTTGGGPKSAGTIFELTPKGGLTTLYSFCAQTNCADGAYPAGLIQANNGNFFATTISGGTFGSGTVFEITPKGALTTLYNFCAQTNCSDGALPAAVLAQGTDGNLYGTTASGGANSQGTVFVITPKGVLTRLHSFCAQPNCTDGAQPEAGLIQGIDGNFYGTTYHGGTNNSGTVFRITPRGKLTRLHTFCTTDCADGSQPAAGLVQGTDGHFYGTTETGRSTLFGGTVFKITAKGQLTTLHTFCTTDCSDGSQPTAGLVQGTDGKFYGTTATGGTNNCFSMANNCGTVYSMSVGLGPFVETRPSSGADGVKVVILGTNLTGATSVTFNGVAANFKVVSRSEITTNVPSGAATGTVQVTTPKGRLDSRVPFRVTR